MNGILPEKLLSFEYYENKLPLYLRQSPSFKSHFRIWYDLLAGDSQYNGVNGASNTLLELLNIFDENYLEHIASLEGALVSASHPYGTKSDVLDKIGNLFCVSRAFSVSYSAPTAFSGDLNLDNKDFLTLIKAQIVKSYCEGTFEQIKAFYEDAGLYCYVLTGSSPLTCTVTLLRKSDNYKIDYSDDVLHMFYAGLLAIKSVGVQYTYNVVTYGNILFWDTDSVWDTGEWL